MPGHLLNKKVGFDPEGLLSTLPAIVTAMLGQFTGILAKYQQNIANMMNKSRDKVAYTLIDLDSEVSEECLAELRAVDAVIRVRVVK